MIWSTIENDACSILCNVTGIAILHNDFINFDIIISSYFPFVLNQPVTRFLSYILLHRALPPNIQLPLSPLSLLPDESLWGKDCFPCLPCYHQSRWSGYPLESECSFLSNSVLCHFHSFFCDIMIIWYIINVEFTKVKRITHYKICTRFLWYFTIT